MQADGSVLIWVAAVRVAGEVPKIEEHWQALCEHAFGDADVIGNPETKHISTSYVERQNLTMRMSMRRLTRLTNAFSKKVDNLRAALNLHFTHYNFVRFHSSLGCTPAMAAGVYHQLMTVRELVERAA